MLNVCVSSTDVDLTTTGALRQLIFGATATSTAEDAYLSNLIRRGSNWAETFVGYPLTFQAYRETVAAFGNLNLMVSRTPIRAVAGLFSDPNSTTPLGSTEYRLENREAGLIQRDLGWEWTAGVKMQLTGSVIPNSELPVWAVEYGAGYVGPAGKESTWDGTTSTGPTLPADIEQAVLLKAHKWYVEEGGITRKKVGDLWIELRQPAADIVGSAEELLLPYRRVAA